MSEMLDDSSGDMMSRKGSDLGDLLYNHSNSGK
jgi:hypothetical protein